MRMYLTAQMANTVPQQLRNSSSSHKLPHLQQGILTVSCPINTVSICQHSTCSCKTSLWWRVQSPMVCLRLHKGSPFQQGKARDVKGGMQGGSRQAASALPDLTPATMALQSLLIRQDSDISHTYLSAKCWIRNYVIQPDSMYAQYFARHVFAHHSVARHGMFRKGIEQQTLAFCRLTALEGSQACLQQAMISLSITAQKPWPEQPTCSALGILIRRCHKLMLV